MSRAAYPSERQDNRIREKLVSPYDIELFDKGTFSAIGYDPILERTGTFADEVLTRVEQFKSNHPQDEFIVYSPAFMLGLVSAVSERRESFAREEVPA